MLTAGVTALGMLASYRAGRRARPATGGGGVAAAVCPCTHPVSFHEGLTGACHANAYAESYSTSTGTERRSEQCRCQHYAGPELVSALTMRPLLPVEAPSDGGAPAE